MATKKITLKELKILVKQIKKEYINENIDNKIFLGYHSSMQKMTDGFYKADVLDISKYEDVIRNAYMDIISDYDDNLENDDIDAMNDIFESRGFGFTFVSDKPIKASAYQTSEYKYGDYLYKVYGYGDEILLDDPNELDATIVVSKKPLFFERI